MLSVNLNVPNQREQALTMVNSLTDLLVDLMDVRGFFNVLLDNSIRTLDAASGFLFLVSRTDRMEYCLGRDCDRRDLEESPLTKNWAERVRSLHEPAPLPGASRGVQVLGAPLKIDGVTIGALCLARKFDEESFTLTDRLVLQTMASHASLALVQARLRDEKDRLHEELAAERSQRQSLEGGSSHLKAFAQFAVHELQTPLRGLRGFADAISKCPPEDDAYERCLQGIRRSSTRLTESFDSLLNFCHAESASVRIERVNLASLYAEIKAELEPTIVATGASVTRGILPWVEADVYGLKTVIKALLQNSLRYSRGRPRVNLEYQEGVFSVSDTGLGIAPDQRVVVFEAFRRLHTREEFPGNGLGLTIARAVVERYGGQIWIDDNPDGIGVILRFTLPNKGAR